MYIIEGGLLLYWQRKQKIYMYGSLKFETIQELFEDHLEGNTKVIFHTKHADTKNPGQIIIRGNDTDIFIISLENVQKLSQSHLWFNTGLDSDNSRSYVDISKLSKELNYGKTLPWIYAYTGTDYSPWVYRKREVRPLLLMIKRPYCLCICGFGQLRSIRKYHQWYWKIYLPYVWLLTE